VINSPEGDNAAFSGPAIPRVAWLAPPAGSRPGSLLADQTGVPGEMPIQVGPASARFGPELLAMGRGSCNMLFGGVTTGYVVTDLAQHEGEHESLRRSTAGRRDGGHLPRTHCWC
jgi:hypothetical protein